MIECCEGVRPRPMSRRVLGHEITRIYCPRCFERGPGGSTEAKAEKAWDIHVKKMIEKVNAMEHVKDGCWIDDGTKGWM